MIGPSSQCDAFSAVDSFILNNIGYFDLKIGGEHMNTSRSITLILGCTIFTLLSGCNKSGANKDDWMKEYIKITNEKAVAYETNSPQAKLDEFDLIESNNLQKLADLKLTDSEKSVLFVKYRSELDRAIQRLATALVSYTANKSNSIFNGIRIPKQENP